MESYRLFLDLASEDPLLRAEAMRRLADLQLETADAVRAARQRAGARRQPRRHDRDVREAARGVSRLQEERPRALPARACVRGRRTARGLARDARQADRGVPADRARRRGAVPARRDAVRRAALRRSRAGVQRSHHGRRRFGVLPAGALQARLVAVQAAAGRGQRRVVLRVARPASSARTTPQAATAIPP